MVKGGQPRRALQAWIELGGQRQVVVIEQAQVIHRVFGLRRKHDFGQFRLLLATTVVDGLAVCGEDQAENRRGGYRQSGPAVGSRCRYIGVVPRQQWRRCLHAHLEIASR